MKLTRFLHSCTALLAGAACALQPLTFGGMLTVAASDAIAIYVSPDGSDSNDGSLSSPLQTLAGARDAVRRINDNMQCDINVYRPAAITSATQPIPARHLSLTVPQRLAAGRRVTVISGQPPSTAMSSCVICSSTTIVPIWAASAYNQRAAMGSTMLPQGRQTGLGTAAGHPTAQPTTPMISRASLPIMMTLRSSTVPLGMRTSPVYAMSSWTAVR